MTAGERDALAASDGMLVYNSTTGTFEGGPTGRGWWLH